MLTVFDTAVFDACYFDEDEVPVDAVTLTCACTRGTYTFACASTIGTVAFAATSPIGIPVVLEVPG